MNKFGTLSDTLLASAVSLLWASAFAGRVSALPAMFIAFASMVMALIILLRPEWRWLAMALSSAGLILGLALLGGITDVVCAMLGWGIILWRKGRTKDVMQDHFEQTRRLYIDLVPAIISVAVVALDSPMSSTGALQVALIILSASFWLRILAMREAQVEFARSSGAKVSSLMRPLVLTTAWLVGGILAFVYLPWLRELVGISLAVVLIWHWLKDSRVVRDLLTAGLFILMTWYVIRHASQVFRHVRRLTPLPLHPKSQVMQSLHQSGGGFHVTAWEVYGLVGVALVVFFWWIRNSKFSAKSEATSMDPAIVYRRLPKPPSSKRGRGVPVSPLRQLFREWAGIQRRTGYPMRAGETARRYLLRVISERELGVGDASTSSLDSPTLRPTLMELLRHYERERYGEDEPTRELFLELEGKLRASGELSMKAKAKRKSGTDLTSQ